MTRYLAEITYYDGQVGQALALLDKHQFADNTLVIVVSEQGSSFPFGIRSIRSPRFKYIWNFTPEVQFQNACTKSAIFQSWRERVSAGIGLLLSLPVPFTAGEHVIAGRIDSARAVRSQYIHPMDACGVERRFLASGSPRDYNRYQDTIYHKRLTGHQGEYIEEVHP